MASKTSETEGERWTGPRVDFATAAARLAARRAALSEPELPRNGGMRRSSSKRALLKAIDDAGGTW